jgi:hypothetical protein
MHFLRPIGLMKNHLRFTPLELVFRQPQHGRPTHWWFIAALKTILSATKWVDLSSIPFSPKAR